ncbi:acyl-CoA dehydrogenase family protein [Hoeflea prorocentri]|uniref:Acyl-CoA dehydrogenase family protein n=2 Tax=Hoeflea prorocentri TaxID=1922333 RepID=A0A9X3ZH41_9HYPH|nr:acyl-CoA dehydrogenase family protein [Hoeflea prorocentri]MCY6380491.1 acyl-CoA dehydrogenase family protein [Hoeflea prorocentri]MDA5398291.1 acyl-CoA dehydrogenase family protein [Hoeflea prorocentri]
MTVNRMTHEVLNQPKPYVGINAYQADPMLCEAAGQMPKKVRDDMSAIGRFVMSPEAQDLARIANQSTPQLKTFDQSGNRIDQVEFHPAYHALMRRSCASGLHSSIWEGLPEEKGIAHQARGIRFFLTAGLECGHLCPVTMTHASLATIRMNASVYKIWAPKILSRSYDSSQKPVGAKGSATIGMGMTEKQGGTDVRANTSRADKAGEGVYRLTGHKWFMSAPMSDAFLMLAQMPEGLGCFLVPRFLEDGKTNGLQFQRLKDKLGNRSNASSEVEFANSYGYLLGEPGKGVRTILEMVTLTRLDCALASAGIMRASLAETVHHCRQRQVFGKALVDQPLMARVQADMALDVAAATALVLRLARAFDNSNHDEQEAAYARVMTPVVKYWICKMAPALIYEAMECLGGNGYVEERALARHYREAPVNAIWEGSGNVMALDLLRTLSKDGRQLEAVIAAIAGDLGPFSKRTVDVLTAAAALCQRDEGAARMFAEQLAYSAAAAELYRLGAGRIADAFAESRMAGAWRTTYGMLDMRFDAGQIVSLLYPEAR